MSYNLVRKGGSVILVKKFRDGGGKVKEHYISSLGVMDDATFKNIRQRCYEHPQNKRAEFCLRSGLVKEVADDIPRRKAPTGDIREQPVKKERKPKKSKKPKKGVIEEIPDDRPEKQSVVLKKISIKGMSLARYKTIRAKKEAITDRINDIEARIKDQAIYLKHYKKRIGDFSKSEKQMRIEEAAGYENYETEGRKAIKILKKQRSEVR